MEENKKLKEELARGGGGGGPGGDPEAERKLLEAQEEMKRNQEMIDEMNKSWEQRMAEANAGKQEEEKRKKEEAEARASGRPQLLNLNQDGILDRKIFIDLSKETAASVGRKQQDQS